MKKILTKILLIGIILFGFSSINQTNASDLDELNSLLNVEEKLNCVNISMKINHDYPNYGRKIHHLIYTLSTKEQKIKMSYYTKIKSLTNKYLLQLDKNRQEKLYTIVGYLKCENEKYLNVLKKGNFELIENGVEIRTYFDGKLTTYYFYLDNQLILEDLSFGDIPKGLPYKIINKLAIKDSHLFIYYKDGEIEKKWLYAPGYNKAIPLKLIKNFAYNLSVWKVKGKNIYYIYNSLGKIIKTVHSNFSIYFEFKGLDYIYKGLTMLIISRDYSSGYDYYIIPYNKDTIYIPIDSLIKTEYKNGYIYIYGFQNGVKVLYKYKNGYIIKADLNEKKGTFIKYIGGGVEARQSKLYTYFYYNGKLINTVKNKIKNDKYLIFGDNYNGDWGDKYLPEYYAKKKLNLYSATFDVDSNRIFFVKKIDNGQINFAYNLEKGKMEDWTFEYFR